MVFDFIAYFRFINKTIRKGFFHLILNLFRDRVMVKRKIRWDHH